MSRPVGSKTVYFRKSKEAREALREQAQGILQQFLDTVKLAIASGDHEVALDSMRWLMEHMPADEDGATMIDSSIDKTKVIEAKPTGNNIKIGIALGGIDTQQKALPAVTVIEEDGNS